MLFTCYIILNDTSVLSSGILERIYTSRDRICGNRAASDAPQCYALLGEGKQCVKNTNSNTIFTISFPQHKYSVNSLSCSILALKIYFIKKD